MPDCGQTVNLLELEAVQEKFFDSVKFCPRSTCKSPKIKLRNEGELECEICQETITIPLYAQSRVVEALKPLCGKGTPKSQLEKRKEKVDTEIIERPEGPDFHWFVQDVARAAKRHSYTGIIAPSSYPNNGKAWVYSIGRYNLDLGKLQKDWGACLRGDKEIAEVSSATYCFTNLLIDSGGIRNKTPENAQALSAALKEQYPQEIERYSKEKEAQLQTAFDDNTICCMPQVDTAKYLSLTDRHIRNLAPRDGNGPLKRCNCEQGKGKRITTNSAREYRKTHPANH